MLAAQIYREWHLEVLASQLQSSGVPRCLFGPADPRETIEILQEALNEERARFYKRWGVDPIAEDEDKENNASSNNVVHNTSGNGKITAVVRLTTPNKKRSAATCPYAKQTSIHDYLRSKKIISPAKKFSSGALTEIKPNQQSQASSQQNHTDKVQLPSKKALKSLKFDRSI